MDIKKIKEERHELLTRMKDSLSEELVACEIREPENENEPEMLLAVLDSIGEMGEMEGGIGEFFFIPPGSEDDTVQHFCCVLTIMDELDTESLPQLFEAMSYVNFNIPCGSYAVDKERSLLCYRLVTPLSMKLSGDDLLENMSISMANAFTAADLYADELIRVASGEKTAEEIRELL